MSTDPCHVSPAAFGGERRAVRLGAVVLVAGIVAAYARSVSAPFVFDDMASILDNASIRHLSDLGAVLSPPVDGSGVTGRPLVNLSLALNYAIGGTAVRGYHVFNLLIHGAAALALFGLARRSLQGPVLGARFGGVAVPLAWLIAATWALHPLQTESVTCIIQRTESLVGMFYLLTLYAFVRGAEAPAPGRWLGVSVAACALGMLSKEVMVTAPVVVLLFDRTFVAGGFAAAWRRRSRYYGALAATWGMLVWLLANNHGARGAAAGFGLGVSWWSYALKQCEAVTTYLRLSVWPHPLVVDYGSDLIERVADVARPGAVLLALLAATIVALWRRPVGGFFGAFFFIVLAPSSSVVPLVTQTMAEHRMYLPVAGVCALLVAGLFLGLGRRGLIAGAALVGGFGWIAANRNADYADEIGLWRLTVTQRPANARAHNILGLALMNRGRGPEATAEFEAAVRLRPDSADYRNSLANAWLQAGDADRAMGEFQRVLRDHPTSAEACNNLGNALVQLARPAEALAAYEAAARLKPGSSEIEANLAAALIELGRLPEAATHGERAVWLRPDSANAHHGFAVALLRQQRFREAESHLVAALRLAPDFAMAHNSLGIVLANTGRPAQAIAEFETAVRLKPDYAQARYNLDVTRRRQSPEPRSN